MKDGYNFYCGERGMRLSSGQKQRITIARAILKILAILLLYEATSALDLRLEALVQDALEKTMVGRNNVIVAHRLSTIKKSNRISVIDNGRVIEEGSHDELLAKGEEGAYFSLFSLQQQASIGLAKIGIEIGVAYGDSDLEERDDCFVHTVHSSF
ncbi:putative multidrug resistance protein [Tanacetum coccineum]